MFNLANFFEKEMKALNACPICNYQSQAFRMQVLAEKPDSQMVYTRCPKCQHTFINIMFQGPLGVGTVGMMTELTPSEVLRFKDSKEISLEDVVSVYQATNKPDFLTEAVKI